MKKELSQKKHVSMQLVEIMKYSFKLGVDWEAILYFSMSTCLSDELCFSFCVC